MKEIKISDFDQVVISKLTNTLKQGYECEVKYVNERVGVNKIKRKLLYKITDKEDIRKYLLDNIIKVIEENPTAKVEFKKEQDKIAIVFVKRQEIK